MYVNTPSLSLDTPEEGKRASNPITDGYEPPCHCRELNSGPLEVQSVLLTTEPPLHPQNNSFINMEYGFFLREASLTVKRYLAVLTFGILAYK